MSTSLRFLLALPVLLVQLLALVSSPPPPSIELVAEDGVGLTEPAVAGGSEPSPAECGYRIFPWTLIAACAEPMSVWELDRTELDRVEEAVRSFTEQGLRLPNLTVSFHDSREGCNGHYGLYELDTFEVQVCTDAAHVLVHELAHAWMKENLDDATRQEFVELRGLDAWVDPDDEWRARGVEDAAILFRMVLTENGGPQNSPGWEDRRHAFELLTGKAHVRN